MRVGVRFEAGKFTRILNLLQFRKLDKASLLAQLGHKIAEQHARRVLSEKTSPDGAAWAALKPSTIRKKGNSNILVDTGRMASAWKVKFTGNSISVQNMTDYLIYHQFGTRKMVARPVMGLSQSNLAELKAVVDRFLASAIGAA